VIATVVLVVVLTAVAALLVVTQRNGMTDQLDDTLEVDAERIAVLARSASEVPGLDDDDRLVVVVVGGEVVTATAELDGGAIAQLVDANDGSMTIDGETHRVVRADEDGALVIVAAPTEDIDETVAGLVRTLALIVPLACLILAITVWMLVGRTLRPVEAIRAEVDAIGIEDLGRRVPQPSGTDEIARLASTMNAMLDRLDRANQRQQRFVADAAHDLRTPLTRIRADLEVGARDPSMVDAVALQRAIRADVAMLQDLIDDLLLLARADADVPTAQRLVDLDDLVLEEARAAGDVDVAEVSAAQVRGDPNALRRVVRNLLDNAQRHAVTGVAVSLTDADGIARLVVDDDGPGVPAGDRDTVFERFSRLEEARTPGDGHSGLGLAIVRSVVVAHGGTVTIDDSPMGGARFTVALPTTG
jgi:signal transduction histidine kinase